MGAFFTLIKITLIILSVIVIAQNIIYMLLNTNNLITTSQIPHIVGMIVGLFLRICGLLAAIREQLLLTIIYATTMALITILTPFNVQFIINLLTSVVAYIYALALKLRTCRAPATRDSDAERVFYLPQQSSRANYNQNDQLLSANPFPSAPPSEPPPYYAPPPSYEEAIK